MELKELTIFFLNFFSPTFAFASPINDTATTLTVGFGVRRVWNDLNYQNPVREIAVIESEPEVGFCTRPVTRREIGVHYYCQGIKNVVVQVFHPIFLSGKKEEKVERIEDNIIIIGGAQLWLRNEDVVYFSGLVLCFVSIIRGINWIKYIAFDFIVQLCLC